MTYTSPTKAMQHQIEYTRRLKQRPGNPTPEDVMAVLGEMGVGKSKMILDEWQAAVAAGELKDLLVIAPAGSYTNWFKDKGDEQLSELKLHLDPKLLEQMVIMPWVTSSAVAAKRLEAGLQITDRPRAMFMNVEALSSVDKAAKAAMQFLSSGKAMLVIDESTRIKSGKAERTKMIIRKLKPLAKVRRIMTGLITPKSPLDLYWQFYFLDWRILGYESPLGFRNHYAITEKKCFLPNEVIRAKLRSSIGLKSNDSVLPDERLRAKLRLIRTHLQINADSVTKMARPVLIRKLHEEASTMLRNDMIDLIPKLGGYIQVIETVKEFRNLEELNKKIAPYSYRVLKKDCLDLKPKIFEPRDVPLTDEQRRLYREMKEYATSALGSNHVTATSVITQMIRMHQIVCGHVVDEDGKIRDIDSRRINEILETLEEHSGKAVIWATYQHEIKKITAALRIAYGPRAVAVYYGGNKSTRGEDETRFLSDPECRFMVSTQSAGGLGNNWVVADLVIYAANSYDLELRAQSEDRCHRKGQKNKVTYVDLVARGTVDEKIIQALRKKIDMATVITGENYREWLV